MATQLLKRAGEHDVKIAGVEIEVAWTLINSLMSLGPNFFRPPLLQLLVLWCNALPKPTRIHCALFEQENLRQHVCSDPLSNTLSDPLSVRWVLHFGKLLILREFLQFVKKFWQNVKFS